ncbi:MAG: sulfur carrier protein ThiS [Bacteroidetes bacterium]|nr:sulfur carrier protein ThiS [Bacteroidota bacterium]
MKITYNGNIHTIEAPCTIHQFLETVGKVTMPMMAKLNGTLIPGKDMKKFQLNEGDSLSVIIFMGGG